MPVQFPNESPGYRLARNELISAEVLLRDQLEEVAAKRRALPTGGQIPQDYVLHDTNGSPVVFSSLFSPQKPVLGLYSFMYGQNETAPCVSMSV
jgi:predicted dithiol-disulfide oxidoreductase (DUF899 family)